MNISIKIFLIIFFIQIQTKNPIKALEKIYETSNEIIEMSFSKAVEFHKISFIISKLDIININSKKIFKIKNIVRKMKKLMIRPKKKYSKIRKFANKIKNITKYLIIKKLTNKIYNLIKNGIKNENKKIFMKKINILAKKIKLYSKPSNKFFKKIHKKNLKIIELSKYEKINNVLNDHFEKIHKHLKHISNEYEIKNRNKKIEKLSEKIILNSKKIKQIIKKRKLTKLQIERLNRIFKYSQVIRQLSNRAVNKDFLTATISKVIDNLDYILKITDNFYDVELFNEINKIALKIRDYAKKHEKNNSIYVLNVIRKMNRELLKLSKIN